MRYELSHDTVARLVYDKASADTQARRKAEKLVRERLAMHRERGTSLLTRDDLDYVRPHMADIRLSAEEHAFVTESERVARRQQLIVRSVVAGVMLVLFVATVVSLRARAESERQARIATAGQLVASARRAIDDSVFDAGALLAVEAARLSDNAEGRSPLLTWRVAAARVRRYLHGHTDGVAAVAYSPDGALLATGGWDDAVILWDAHTGALRARLTGHADDVNALAFSPDGRTLASASNDSTVILWDVDRQAQRLRLRDSVATSDSVPGRSGVTALVFSRDGATVIGGGENGTLWLWDATTGAVRTRVKDGPGFTSLDVDPSGHTLLEASTEGEVRFRNLATMTVKSLGQVSRYVNVVRFSPDGQRFAVGTGRGEVDLGDVSFFQNFDGPAEHATTSFIRYSGRFAISALAFRPDGGELATGSWGGQLQQWNLANGNRYLPLRGHSNTVLGVAYSPDGRTMASAGEDGTVVLWETSTESTPDTVLSPGSAVTSTPPGADVAAVSVAFSPNGALLATGRSDGAIDLRDGNTFAVRSTLSGHHGVVTGVGFSPDGRVLYSGSTDSTVMRWDVATGRALGPPWPQGIGAVFRLRVSPDGNSVAAGGEDGTIALSSADSVVPVALLRAGATGDPGCPSRVRGACGISGLAFSPDGTMLVSANGVQRAVVFQIFDIRGGNDYPLLGDNALVVSAAFSPRGSQLALGSSTGALLFYNAERARQLGPPRAPFPVLSPVSMDEGRRGGLQHPGPRAAASLSFSADGETIASGHQGIVIWDAKSLRPRGAPLLLAGGRPHYCASLPSPICPGFHTYGSHGEDVEDLAFSRDGRLAAVLGDGRVALWDFRSSTLERRACAAVGRNLSRAEWRAHFGPDVPYRRTCAEWPSGDEAPANAPVGGR